MDPKLEEWLKQHCGPNCYGEQDENGVDLSLIRENLKLTPTQRLSRASRYSKLLVAAVGETTARSGKCLTWRRMTLLDAFEKLTLETVVAENGGSRLRESVLEELRKEYGWIRVRPLW